MNTNSNISGLPINLDDLLYSGTIEGTRIEYKATWNEMIALKATHTICAFANDILNLNGGYLILGVEDHQGKPQIVGLKGDLEKIQKEIIGKSKRITPSYTPLIFPEQIDGHDILVVWVPGGDNRPYQAPISFSKDENQAFFIRVGPETRQAKGTDLTSLLELAAKTPFDDRICGQASFSDISSLLVKSFLQNIKSELALLFEASNDATVYSKLRLLSKTNGTERPRNVSMLFFNEEPVSFFGGAQIQIVQFDDGGDLIEEKTFRGPINSQIKSTLSYLETLGGSLLQKVAGQSEVERTIPYPFEAMEEAIVNSMYHRSYESPEPTKIYLYHDRMEITSYPGPVAGILPEHFMSGNHVPPVPNRNRRIGEILQELRLAEGKGTGIPKINRRMREHGSPPARFDFDAGRTYFRVVLPVHPHYEVLNAMRQSAYMWTVGNRRESLNLLNSVFERRNESGSLANQIVEYASALGEFDIARMALARYEQAGGRLANYQPFMTFARILLDSGRTAEAAEILKDMPVLHNDAEVVEIAILKKRSGDLRGAHQAFQEAMRLFPNDPKVLQEYAQTKIAIARTLGRSSIDSKRRLNREAAELLRRGIALSDNDVRSSWCWLDLARTLEWLRAPGSEIEEAYMRARTLNPAEERILRAFDSWSEKNRRR